MLVRESNLNQKSFEYPKDWGQGNRGVWAGGGNFGNGTWTNRIDYINIVTPGNSTQFGTSTRYGGSSGTSGRGRGLIIGGHITSSGQPPGLWDNKIQYVTIATTGNGTNFGDLTRATAFAAAVSNGTRALICGGYSAWATGGDYTDIYYITIATPGNATEFGSIASGKIAVNSEAATSCVDATGNGVYGMFKCSASNQYDYINISTPGNSSFFGTVTGGGAIAGAVSNGTRAIWDRGNQNLEYFTWSMPAVNALQFGKWITINGHDSYNMVGVDNGSYGVFGGGHSTGSAMFKFSMDGTPTSALIGTDIGDLYMPVTSTRWGVAGFAGD